ncbi:TetR/AcrR family transcriptional regulator [Actinosynnema sp. NPDC091369]
MRRSAAQTRELVLEVAHRLFYWDGIRATGVDRIAAQAGIAPTTLYRLFESKDHLVAAYVARAFEHTRRWVTEAIRTAGPDPRQQILAVFDAQRHRIQPGLCRGCVFLMTIVEFPDRMLPGHQHSISAKEWLLGLLRELTAKLDLPHPDAVADQLMLIIEGVHASSQAFGPDGPATRARELAEVILGLAPEDGRHATPGPPRGTPLP